MPTRKSFGKQREERENSTILDITYISLSSIFTQEMNSKNYFITSTKRKSSIKQRTLTSFLYIPPRQWGDFTAQQYKHWLSSKILPWPSYLTSLFWGCLGLTCRAALVWTGLCVIRCCLVLCKGVSCSWQSLYGFLTCYFSNMERMQLCTRRGENSWESN